jgi:predicted Zn finger-like uncharacterized protein
MPFKVECPSCGATLQVPDHAAGRKVKCARCSTVLSIAGGEEEVPTVPAAAEEVREPAPRRPRRPRDGDAAATPRRGGNLGLIIGLGAAFLVVGACCCGGVGVGIYYHNKYENNARVTKANFDRITGGMTLVQIEGILGSGRPVSPGELRDLLDQSMMPAFARSSFESAAAQGHVLLWKNGKTIVLIAFDGPPARGGKAMTLNYSESSSSGR